MDQFKGLLITLVLGAWVIILFYGFITGVGKSFKQNPQQSPKESATEILQEQRARTKNLADQQKRLMEDRQQRLKDMQQMRMP